MVGTVLAQAFTAAMAIRTPRGLPCALWAILMYGIRIHGFLRAFTTRLIEFCILYDAEHSKVQFASALRLKQDGRQAVIPLAIRIKTFSSKYSPKYIAVLYFLMNHMLFIIGLKSYPSLLTKESGHYSPAC